MKLVNAPAETANPFAEAAGEAAMPGGVGIPGSVGTVEAATAAWNAAVQGVSLDIDGMKVETSAAATPEPLGVEMLPVPALDQASTEPGPMGAQWDRLSMTVASLVAWNLTSEVAPDTVEDLAVRPEILAGSLTASEGVQGQDLGESKLGDAVDLALAAQAATFQGRGQGHSAKPVTEHLPSQDLTAPVVKQADTISARIFGQTGSLLMGRPSSSEVSVDSSRTLKADLQGTESQLISAAVSQTPSIVSQTPSMVSSIALDAAKQTTQVVSEAAVPLSLADVAAQLRQGQAAPGLEPVLTGRSDLLSANADGRFSTANSISQPTAVVPADLAPLGMYQTLRSGAAQPQASTAAMASSGELAQGPEFSIGRESQTQADLRSQAEARPTEAAGAPAPRPSSSPATQMPVTAAGRSHEAAVATNSDSPVVAAPTSDEGTLLERLSRPQPGAERQRTRVASHLDTSTTSVDGSVGAGAGSHPISESERDFSVNESLLDAETITADEVPELPLADTQHFDIDIDDPGGQVRLDLTRSAEEVAIRIETPDKIVEEYRNLEQDIEDALKEAGLSLADYEASSEGERQAPEDSERREQASSEPQDRKSETDDGGDGGRLLNRIV
jgi:hypothetical protein